MRDFLCTIVENGERCLLELDKDLQCPHHGRYRIMDDPQPITYAQAIKELFARLAKAGL